MDLDLDIIQSNGGPYMPEIFVQKGTKDDLNFSVQHDHFEGLKKILDIAGIYARHHN